MSEQVRKPPKKCPRKFYGNLRKFYGNFRIIFNVKTPPLGPENRGRKIGMPHGARDVSFPEDTREASFFLRVLGMRIFIVGARDASFPAGNPGS